MPILPSVDIFSISQSQYINYDINAIEQYNVAVLKIKTQKIKI